MSITRVLAPCPGRLHAITDAPDPVFAGEMVGPGLMIEPEPVPTTVVSPVAGRLVKLLPHAFVVLGAVGIGVLVHLGLNTVQLEGRGFEVVASQGSTVEAGAPVVRGDPSTMTGPEISTLVVVVATDLPAGSVPAPEPGVAVAAGDLLFTVEG